MKISELFTMSASVAQGRLSGGAVAICNCTGIEAALCQYCCCTLFFKISLILATFSVVSCIDIGLLEAI